ncbi:MAG: phosphoenolpyruvate kinase [Candidatus Eisenbacteria bacterium]|nr:phosphoenolpyruvate kinase [Candidatus Eisenbacteria bacterium]
MKQTLPDDISHEFLSRLSHANSRIQKLFPGDRPGRQPVHTVYGGAHLFRYNTAPRLGKAALTLLNEYGAETQDFGLALSLPPSMVESIHERIRGKLAREPVEDFRIDFEDGYGNRSDAEEDGHAISAAKEVAKGHEAGSLPPFLGIRIKPLSEELKARSLRTLDLFLTTVLDETGGKLPANFVVTLPKITSPDQPAVLADVLSRLEAGLALPAGSLVFELMIETTQSIINERGEIAIRALIDTAPERIIAAHFGTYDYTASCSITAAWQTMDHPACDFARHVMQVALAGTGIWLSDGATNVLPVPPHRPPEGGTLTAGQAMENRRVVHDAWRLHHGHVRRSLEHAYYQGWDLHPGQLPTRYAAVFGFFMEGLDAAAERLSNFVGKAAQATLVGDIFDDAATGQGLLNYFLRAINCGALTEEEAVARTGVSIEEFRGRSFVTILQNRRGVTPA